jgi:hypothetical protein
VPARRRETISERGWSSSMALDDRDLLPDGFA